jgi:hypothetical protein
MWAIELMIMDVIALTLQLPYDPSAAQFDGEDPILGPM